MGGFLQKGKYTHTQAWAVEERVVDKGKDVLFYIRDAFVYWGLTQAGKAPFFSLNISLPLSIIQSIVASVFDRSVEF